MDGLRIEGQNLQKSEFIRLPNHFNLETQNEWKKHPFMYIFSTFGSKINEFEWKKSEKNDKISKT